MVVFPIWIEHALNVAVQCSHDADVREYRWPAQRRDQDQGFHRACHSSASCSAFGSFVM
jgi:hypothetical protein